MLPAGIVSESVQAVVDTFSFAVSTLLGINYAIASTLRCVVEHTVLLVYQMYLLLLSATEDFEKFLVELLSFTSAILDFALTASSCVYSHFATVFRIIASFSASLIAVTSVALQSVSTLTASIFWTLSYLVSVCAGALLMLLQMFPCCLAQMVRLSADGVKCLLQAVHFCFLCTKDSFVRLFIATAEYIVVGFQQVPTDAYMGMVMVLAFYFLFTKTALGSLVSLQKLLQIAVGLFNSVGTKTKRLFSRVAPRESARLLRFVRLCLGRIRCWLSNNVLKQRVNRQKNSTRAVETLRKALELEKERNLCIICQEEQRSVILLPCRHMCLCDDCCVQLLDRRSTCPLCRTVILNPIQVFT